MSKEYASVEEALVKELGAEFIGTSEKLGEFPIEDGDDLEGELLCEGLAWLKQKKLMTARDRYTWTSVKGVPWGDGVNIRVLRGEDAWTEYRFSFTKEGPRKKRFHMVEVFVLVPPQCCGGGHEMGA